MLRLPEPMLAKAGSLPTRAGWTFEPKLDGFRCLVCTHGGRFRARSRRGWNMTTLLPELERTLPADVQLDGELVALDPDGRPDFHRLGNRMLHGRAGIPVVYFVFDVLAVEGLPVTAQPYTERRTLLEELDVEGPHVAARGDVRGRRSAVPGGLRARARGSRRETDARAVPAGERGWVKHKNRATARFAEEARRARSPLAELPTGGRR